MELAEIKERYKLIPQKKRLAGAAGAGLLLVLFAYFYSYDFTALDEELVNATTAVDGAKQKFEAAKAQKANLPKLEAEVAITEEQLAKAKAKLPAAYDIEDTLHKTSTIAKELNVYLTSFAPGTEIVGGANARYAELPIAVTICGTYGQVASFFDRIVHLEQSVKVRDIKMRPLPNGCPTDPANGVNDGQENARQDGQASDVASKERRRRQRVETNANLVLFRADQSAGPEPAAAPAAPVEAPPASDKVIESATNDRVTPRPIVKGNVQTPAGVKF